MSDAGTVDLMMSAVFSKLKLEGVIGEDPDTPLVRELMQAIIDALREAGEIK